MINKIRNFLGKNYVPLNKLDISKKALIANYNYLSSLNPKVKIAPVLKSNAYGHGLVKVAKILDLLEPPMFCVDSIYEAYDLIRAGIKSQIFIMGYIHPDNLKIKKLPFSYAVYSTEQLEVINKFQPGAEVHLKIDTGMHRLGIPFEQFEDFTKNLKKHKHTKIAGLMSHIASQEDLNNKLTIEQLDKFQKALEILKKFGINPQWIHIAASQIFLEKTTKIAKISNMARVGLALYGINPSQTTNELKPSLMLTSQIVQIKKLNPGNKVGYLGTFTANREMKIAVLPIGYNDGVDRRLSNSGYVLVKNKPCKIIGIVSMNITTVDLSQAPSAKVGDKVIIFSDNPKAINSISKSSKICQTIPYDLLVGLHPTAIRREITP